MKTKYKEGRVKIFDTTLRDGEQAPGFHMTPEAKLQIARALAGMGVDVIEAGFPASSPADYEAVRTIARTVGSGKDAPEICVLARAIPSDIDVCWKAVEPARHPRIHLFLAASDIHLKHKLRMTRADALKKAAEAVRHARKFTPNVQFAAEDASRADRKFLVRMIETVIDAGATTVNIPDTVGYAVPEEFSKMIREIASRTRGIERARISVHCHDDLGMAVANSLAAVKAGARQVECTLNGIGERAGNCSLEEVVMALRTRRNYFGVDTGIQSNRIVAASRLVADKTGVPVPPNKAIVGANAFAHAAGIHQDGFLKRKETYEIMRPEDVGFEGSQIVLTSRSGRSALSARFQRLGHRIRKSEINGLFERFKAVADRKRFVNDRDLEVLARSA